MSHRLNVLHRLRRPALHSCHPSSIPSKSGCPQEGAMRFEDLHTSLLAPNCFPCLDHGLQGGRMLTCWQEQWVRAEKDAHPQLYCGEAAEGPRISAPG